MNYAEHSFSAPVTELVNDTIINVAQLLQEPVGSVRDVQVQLDWFALDTDLMARDVVGQLRLMRITDGILVRGPVEGVALIECVRCLEIYDQAFKSEIEQEYRALVDVQRGVVIEDLPEQHDDNLDISETHELDLGEPIRQFAILAMPMQPLCGEDCPGLDQEGDEEELGDHRFAALAALLDDVSDGED